MLADQFFRKYCKTCFPNTLKMPIIHNYQPTQTLHAASSFPGRWLLRVYGPKSNGLLVERSDLDVFIDLLTTRRGKAVDEETIELSDNRYLSYSRNMNFVFITV